MGRAEEPGPEPRRVPQPPTRAGAGAEGWEGGGTDVWAHLNPFPTRPDAVRESPSAASGPRGLCGGSQVDAPFFFCRSPSGSGVRRPEGSRLWDGASLPRLSAGGQRDGLPSLFSCSPLAGAEVWGCSAPAPTPPPGSKYLPRPGLHTKPRARWSPALSPRLSPPFPRHRSLPPLPSSLSRAGPLRLLLSPPPSFSPDPSTGSGLARSYQGWGPTSSLGHTDSAVSPWVPSLSFVRRVL